MSDEGVIKADLEAGAMTWRRGRAYAQDLRDRVLAATGRLREVAERSGVSQAYLCVTGAFAPWAGWVRPAQVQRHNHVPLHLEGLRGPLLAQGALAPEQPLDLCMCTINGVEHLKKEIKRRTQVATLFPNSASCLRLVSAILAEQDEECMTAKIYLTMKT
ncbi:MAG: transposase [Polaromonas sp.]